MFRLFRRVLRRANEGRIAAIKRGKANGSNRLKAGESCRAIAKTYRVHHATVGRLRNGGA